MAPLSHIRRHFSDRFGDHLSDICYRLPADPRFFQIAVLSGLLAYGGASGAFEIDPYVIAAVFGAAIATQFLGAVLNATRFEVRSAAITSLSLLLLLRADAPIIMAGAAAIAIGSKFLIRLYDKHVFNPANAGIVALLIISNVAEPGSSLSGVAWTTPGQWGTALWLAALLAGLGVFVTSRAARLDAPLAFFAVFAALAIARALWLGDPLAIPVNRLQNGALVLFAFFMLSDPKTTPDGSRARIVFAGLIAVLSHWLIFHQFVSDGMFYALFAACALRPIFDAVATAPRYAWPQQRRRALSRDGPPTAYPAE
ncbi:MAG: RnfABCDGE type electron transport complex subunit D [Pseudomonadota bacterium]